MFHLRPYLKVMTYLLTEYEGCHFRRRKPFDRLYSGAPGSSLKGRHTVREHEILFLLDKMLLVG